ncbi:MAG TPA: hypothetical protein VMV72_01575 [Verrucomicrobiae bacterium]|nr:hypothetical protein [Verrucomicrobiae bacterium]
MSEELTAVQAPVVQNIAYDVKSRITYVIMASRQLTRQELRVAVAAHLGDLENHERPKRGQAVTIYSDL